MDVSIDDRELQAAIGKLRAAGQNVLPKLRVPVTRQMLKVQAQAQKLTPADGDRSLRRSAQTDVEFLGGALHAKVTFGGLASKYAEVQHENEDFAHTPEEYARKYGKPLNRNGYTRQTLRGAVGKRGKITIKSKVWKYKRKRRITGYTGGQAHFLYGARNSAWNDESRRELEVTIALHGERAIDEALGGTGTQ